MLKSANDAAYVLAEHVGGSVEGFSDMMNKKLKNLVVKIHTLLIQMGFIIVIITQQLMICI